jgi:hypothetical protein
VCPVEPLPRRWNARFCLLLSLFSPADVACAGNDHCVILDEKRTTLTYLRDFAPSADQYDHHDIYSVRDQVRAARAAGLVSRELMLLTVEQQLRQRRRRCSITSIKAEPVRSSVTKLTG